MKKNNMLKKWTAMLFSGVMIASTLLASGCNMGESSIVDGLNYGIDEKTVTAYASEAKTEVCNLKTSGMKKPEAVDSMPTFSWELNSNVIGKRQTAYSITVKKGDSVVWTSGKVNRNEQSVICPASLSAKTDYTWTVTVYDENDNAYVSDVAEFRTGLMNDRITAWSYGTHVAEWIGHEELQLNADTLSIFDGSFDFQVSEKSKFGYVFGANDMRLQYAPYNTFLINNDEQYVMIQFDFSTLSATSGVTYRVIRKNYCSADVKKSGGENVLRTGEIPTSLISESNYTEKHSVKITIGNNSLYAFSVNGTSVLSSRVVLNPYYSIASSSEARLKFPVLGDMGFYADGTVQISNLKISNQKKPYGVLFGKDVGATYSIYEGKEGVTVGDTLTFTDTFVTADPSYGSATYLRNTFDVTKTVASANLYVAARGVYEYYVNGKKVVAENSYYTDAEGNKYYDDYLNPGNTEYWEVMYYSSYDVKDMLVSGTNAMGAILSSGWWCDDISYSAMLLHNYWGDKPGLLSMLEVVYTDGTKKTVLSDTDTWSSYNDGPIRYSGLMNGEYYDSGKEANVEGFSTVNYDDSKWSKACVVETRESYMQSPRLVGRRDEPIHVFEVLDGEYMGKETRKGHSVYLYNMGANMAGIPEIRLPEMPEGVSLVLRYGEIQYPDLPEGNKYNYGDLAGLILTENYRGAMSTDIYVTSGKKGGETYIPSFTSHGYQYIELSFINTPAGFDADAIIKDTVVKGRVTTSLTELTSTYETDNKLANQLFKNIERSTLGNHISIPTDCPQRNERMGWTGDVNVYSQTATYMTDITPIYTAFFENMRANQSTNKNGDYGDYVPFYNGKGAVEYDPNAIAWDCIGWAGAGVRAPYHVYKQTGNLDLIEEHWNSMVMFIDAYTNNVASNYGHSYLLKATSNSDPYGDWLSIQSTDKNYCTNVYYGQILRMMAEMATALGKDSDAAKYTGRYEGWFNEFNRHMVKDGFPCTLVGDKLNTETAFAIAIDFEVLTEENLEILLKNYTALVEHKDYGITSGFLGTASLLPALSKNGKVEEAYAMFENTEYASWLYPVVQGATSIWERWDSYTIVNGFKNNNSMNSFNHYSLGAVGTWMLGYQAGIYAGENGGYSSFFLQPQQGGNFKEVSASYHSTHGVVKSEWTSDGKGNLLTYECYVPANTTATLYLNVNEGALKNFQATPGMKYLGMEEHNGLLCAKFTLSGGGYRFEMVKGEVQNKLYARIADSYYVEN